MGNMNIDIYWYNSHENWAQNRGRTTSNLLPPGLGVVYIWNAVCDKNTKLARRVAKLTSRLVSYAYMSTCKRLIS